MFAFCQLTFTGGRFIGAALLRFIDTAVLLSAYGVACIACCLGTALSTGYRGVASLFLLFFFESICYPVRFSYLCNPPLLVHMLTGPAAVRFHARNAWLRAAHEARVKSDCHGECRGPNPSFTKKEKKRKEKAERAFQGVGGGAWFPSAQGALADKAYTRRSYLVPLVGFIAMATYAMYVPTLSLSSVPQTRAEGPLTVASSSTRRSNQDSTSPTVAPQRNRGLRHPGTRRQQRRMQRTVITRRWKRRDSSLPHGK